MAGCSSGLPPLLFFFLPALKLVAYPKGRPDLCQTTVLKVREARLYEALPKTARYDFMRLDRTILECKHAEVLASITAAADLSLPAHFRLGPGPMTVPEGMPRLQKFWKKARLTTLSG